MSQKGQQHQFVATTATPLDGPVEGVRPDDGVAPKADRGRSTPRRRLLGERHPEPRARVRAVRLKLSSRQADDPLLRLQFAIIIAPGNLRPCSGQSYAPVFRAAASGPDVDGLYLAQDLTS